MPTKEKTKNKKRYLRDDIAGIVLNDDSCRGFVERLVSKALDIDEDIVKDNLILKTPRINENASTMQSYVDAIFENNTSVINIEVNYNKSKASNMKNMRYVCHMMLKQTSKKKKLKPIYQININNFDYFNEHEFIYRSYILEEKYNKKRNDFISIIDINVDFLTDKSYNEIEGRDSLERLLYFFVCDNKEVLDKLYRGDEVMENVQEKLERLNEDLDAVLYYDREELRRESSFEEGEEIGIKKGQEQKSIEIAKNMLKDKVAIDIIVKYTGLTKEEIEALS